jgi:outer membrane phospholipase A
MFWDIGKDSSPFKDVNYNPELFYRLLTPDAGILKSVDIGIYEHKSNGLAGDSSRAWSRSYIKFNTTSSFYKWTFNWDTKIFGLYNFSLDDTNRDIWDYMGFWETKIYFVNFFDLQDLIDRAQLYLSFFSGGKYSQHISKGGQELGFKFRLGWGKFYPFVFFQAYHGYNESLLDYNKEYWAYRLGLAF